MKFCLVLMVSLVVLALVEVHINEFSKIFSDLLVMRLTAFKFAMISQFHRRYHLRIPKVPWLRAYPMTMV